MQTEMFSPTAAEQVGQWVSSGQKRAHFAVKLETVWRQTNSRLNGAGRFQTACGARFYAWNGKALDSQPHCPKCHKAIQAVS